MEEFPIVCRDHFDLRNYPPQKPKITTWKVCLGLVLEFQHNAELPAVAHCEGRRAGQQDPGLRDNARIHANPSCPFLEEHLWPDVVAVVI